jgi:sporulation protein YlmC with PRC-barrel domain
MDDGGLLDPIDETGRRALPPVGELIGLEVRDVAGERVGKVADAYTDTTGEMVRYVAVSTGWFGTRRHMIPADELRLGNDGAGDFLSLPYDQALLREGPSSEADEEMTRAHEETVYAHYGRTGYWIAARDAPTDEDGARVRRWQG